MVSNRVKERIGINKVASVVENRWECGWQEYGAQNDDAIDGLILMRRGRAQPKDTGGIVFVQVKCGGNGYRQDQKQFPNHLCIQLGSDYIEKHRPRWIRVPGPVILVFVDDTLGKENPPAWWTDLRRDDSYSPTNAGAILIPKSQRFEHHSKGRLQQLCGSGNVDRQLEEVVLDRSSILIPTLGKGESLRNDAWNFYKTWRANSDDRRNPSIGPVLVNRVGWKHMTRAGRLPERIVQSWTLIGAAREMVKSCGQIYTLGHASTKTLDDGNSIVTDYLGLRARVTFPHRHHCVAQVVLKRSRLLAPENPRVERQKIWFYSIYETRRGRSDL